MNRQSNGERRTLVASARSPWFSIAPLLWKVPALSERMAARYFLTPWKHAVRGPQPKTPGERMVVLGKRPVVIHVYGRGAPVFLVHGWGGSAQQMAGFVDTLVARGYRAVTVDLPAHGGSAGQRTDVLECSDALLALARRVGDPAGIVAHSFGAAAVALAVQRGLATGALVFVAPLPSMDQGLHHFAKLARLPLPVMDRAARRIENELGFRRSLIDLTSIGRGMRVPLLCIHDQNDSTTRIDATREVVEVWPGARLLETTGLGHRRILESQDVIDHAAAFLSQGHRERPIDLERAICDGRLAAGADGSHCLH